MSDDEYEPPYIVDSNDPYSARVNGSQALQLIHKYIQKIPVDRFTRLTPVWEVKKVNGTSQVYNCVIVLLSLTSARMLCLLDLEFHQRQVML